MVRWREAKIDERKILDYLLAENHPVGSAKAAFFIAVGDTREDWTQLRDDLMNLARHGETVAENKTEFGTKYVVDGVVQTPTGRMVGLRTVWITDEPDSPPRLVTALPSYGEFGDVPGT